VDPKGVLGAFVAFYWGGAMVGRFAGTLLTAYFPPSKVLALFGASALVLVAISLYSTGPVSMGALLAVGLFNSILFPTIFALSVEGLGDLKPQGSGVLCTAIVGGAIVPPLVGLVADGHGFKTAFVLVLLCYGYIVAFGMKIESSDT
jgi:FHS family L-fucose permease-like MFS transporter